MLNPFQTNQKDLNVLTWPKGLIINKIPEALSWLNYYSMANDEERCDLFL